MRILYLIVLIALFSQTIHAQNVGIGDNAFTPDPSAGLEVQYTDKGVLIPRVALTSASDAATILSPATSLLIYNDGTGGLSSAGYYYNNGTPASPHWERFVMETEFQSNSLTSWTLMGNDLGIYPFGYIGTNDLYPLVFKTNALYCMQLQVDGTLSLGTATDNDSRLYVITPPANTTDEYGIYNIHAGSTTNNTYAIYNNNFAQTNNTKYGVLNRINDTGIGGRYGIYNYIEDNILAYASSYGNYNFLHANGNVDHYGIANYLEIVEYNSRSNYAESNAIQTLSPTSISTNYGTYTRIFGSSLGDNYGIYLDVQGGANNYAVMAYSGHSIFNEIGGDYDFRVKGVLETDLLFVDASTDNVGIGTDTPSELLEVDGNLRINGGIHDGTDFGTVGYVLTTDGAGDIMWQDPSGLGSDTDDWKLLGNSGTVSGTNFIGTTDAVELDFRTNNIIRLRMTTKGQLETMNTGHSVFIGEFAGESDDLTDNYNTFIGYNTGFSNTTGENNFAGGHNAMYNATTGNNYNLALGEYAMYGTAAYNYSYNNVALGAYSLYSINGGDDNVAIGSTSLYTNTTGSNNIAMGLTTMYSNTTGSNNVAEGKNVMYNSTTGSNNVAQGYEPMYNASVANHNNVAIGHSAMRGTAAYSNSNYNVAIGFAANNSVSGGDDNVSIGHNAGYSMTSGGFNIFMGRDAGYSVTTGQHNVNIGYWAGYSSISGERNVAIGSQTLMYNTGSYNTAVGQLAGFSWHGYTFCSFFGYSADATGDYSNATALGFQARVTSHNMVRVGGNMVTRIEGQVPWTSTSDGRIKENVVEDVAGVDFIMKLRPVTYNFNKDKQDQILGHTDSTEYPEKYAIENIRFSGFIAQEVEIAANEVGYDFSGVKKPAHENDLYGLTYSDFVVPLVKATQEQQEIIEQQQKTIEMLQQQNADILKRLEELEAN